MNGEKQKKKVSTFMIMLDLSEISGTLGKEIIPPFFRHAEASSQITDQSPKLH